MSSKGTLLCLTILYYMLDPVEGAEGGRGWVSPLIVPQLELNYTPPNPPLTPSPGSALCTCDKRKRIDILKILKNHKCKFEMKYVYSFV